MARTHLRERVVVAGFVGLVALGAVVAIWAFDLQPARGLAWFGVGGSVGGLVGHTGARWSEARRRARDTPVRRPPRGLVLLASAAGVGVGALLWPSLGPEQLLVILGLGAGLVIGLARAARWRDDQA